MRKFHTGIFFSCEQAADMNGKPDVLTKTGSEDGGSRNQTIYVLQENLICTSLRDEVRKQTESADVGPSHRKILKT